MCSTKRAAFLLLLVTVLSCAGTGAWGKIQIGVEAGWGDQYRMGRWMPLFVTLADNPARAALLEVSSPYDMNYEVAIRQQIAISPSPATYPLYLPLNNTTETQLTVRDAASGKILLSASLEDLIHGPGSGRSPYWGPTNQTFVGVSGRSATVRRAVGQLHEAGCQSGSLEIPRLPAMTVGYDALDALVLDAPDFTAITVAQQQAIADWVRSGGVLIIWPSADPWPASSPLIDLMPGQVGDVTTLELSDVNLNRIGLPKRFGQLTVRTLRPATDATAVSLGGPLQLLQRRVGLGQILLLPVDASQLQFTNLDATKKFWQKVMECAGLWRDGQNNGYGVRPDDQRHTAAVQYSMDQLGNIPGIGQFGFSYVTIIMVALILIVGPVDWLVLKLLGRQPWTWITTTFWIVLITTGAIFIGHFVRSGDLYYRSLRVVDQVGEIGLGAVDLTCIYSPRTRLYDLQVPPDSWWLPASINNYYYGRNGIARRINFHQVNREERGNYPLPMLIHVWNLQFLEGQSDAAQPAWVEAKLSMKPGGKGQQVTGEIKNLSPWLLKNLCLRGKDGMAKIEGTIAPGATLAVNTKLQADSTHKLDQVRQQYGYGYYGNTNQLELTGLPATVLMADLAARRSERIEFLLRTRDDLLCLYAECDNVQPIAQLKADNALQQHRQILRAVVPTGP